LIPERSGFGTLAVGCSDGAAPTGLIDKTVGNKRIRREGKQGTARFWEVNREYKEGRSGGPLLDAHGHLLGMLSGTSNGRSYFCHVEEIRAFLQKEGLE
jgi:hypothetical protein